MTSEAHVGLAAPAGAFPLGTAQTGLWAAELINPGNSANVTAQYSEILGALDVTLFERASRQVIDDTEALRLCFGGSAEQPKQWVTSIGLWSLPLIDLSSEPNPHGAALDWMKRQHARPLDVGSGRAFRWTLLRLGATHFVWSFQVHHLLMDGFSRNIVWRRLDQVFTALAAGAAAPPEPASLRDLFAQEHEYSLSASFDEDRRYFDTLLHGRPGRMTLSGTPAATGREFRRATSHLPSDVVERLRTVVSGSSLARVITAAAALLQHREVGGEDLILGFTVSARLGDLARRTPSMLSNIVPLRLRLHAAIDIQELLSRAGRAIREVVSHQRYPSQALRRDLQLSPLEPDIYGLTVNFMPFDTGHSFGGHPASTHNLSNGPVANLTIGVFDSPGQSELRVDLNGNRELYDDATLAKYLCRLVELLTAIADGPATRPVSALFTKDEAPSAYLSRLDTAEEVRFLGPRFDAIAGERGDAVALVDGFRRFSYRDLLMRSAALTTALRARGIGPGDRVGIALPRSAEMVMAVVGIVRSGAAYVPVDLAHPKERRALILADAHPRLVVSDDALPDIECLQVPRAGESDPTPAVVPSENDEAYVIYTSGSTGRPNGVRVTQRNVARLFTVTQPLYDFGPLDVWTLFHSLAFDVSVFELWGALLTGGRLVVVPADTAKATDAFHDLVLREGVTILSQTPSAFRAFDAADTLASRPTNRLRQVILAGEMLDPRTLKGWFDAHGDLQPRVVNMYGITETTVHTTFRPMRAQDTRGHGQSPIGVPLSDLSIELLDPDGGAVDDFQIGEIWVSGAGVTLGYIERPELTARRFHPDPGRGVSALRYRSGDLARRLPDGDFEYLGRSDQQVKLRGFRIELGEIEAALRELPSVRDAVVTLRDDTEVGPSLVAYIVSERAAPLERDSIRQQLINRLPEYMVPAAFVRIERVPRTVNDKVDRKGLPAPSEQDVPTSNSTVAPCDELEQTIANVFCETLARRVAQRESDFFRLGGHSLLAVRATLLCRERLQVELPVRALFENPTVAALASVVREMQKQGRGHQPLAHVERVQPVPLSPQQHALWLEVQLRPDDGLYNVPMAFSTARPLDRVRMRKALVQLARMHEVLRGRLLQDSGGPRFLFDRDPAEIELDWVDGPEPEANFETALRRPFHLSRGPLWRCVVRSRPDGRVFFAIVVHHLIIDAAGAEVLLGDLAEAYSSPDRPLGKRPYDMADLAVYENERLSVERESLERFWADMLRGVEALELPTPLSPCLSGEELASVRARHALPDALSVRVRERAAEFGTTPFHLYFAAYLALLRTYTSSDDMAVGSLVSLRDTPAAQKVVGYLLAPVVLRMSLHASNTFRDTVAELAHRWNLVRANARLPMDSLVRTAAQTQRAQTGSPFQFFFSLLEEDAEQFYLDAQAMTPLETVPASAKFQLFLQVEHCGPAATITLESQRGVLDPQAATRLLVHLETLLQGAVDQPHAKLSELSLLTPTERARIAEWGVNSRPYPKGRTVVDLFEEVARARPEAIALVSRQLHWTYTELDERANAVAAELHALGVTRGDRVPLLLRRSAASFVCALGVLKAGAAYVPIDPMLPTDRRVRLLSGLSARVGYYELDAAPDTFTRWLTPSASDRRLTAPPPRQAMTADDAAYIMFTSGSTGQPKGVEIPHRGIVRLVRGQDFGSMGEKENWLQLSPTSFDASTLEIWGPLLNGGRCILVEEDVPTPTVLSEVIKREGATSAFLTSSLFNVLVDEQPECLAGLRQILIGGEALSPAHIRRAIERLPSTRLVNGYGPTENTTFTCCHPITRADVEPIRAIPIGRPIANTSVQVLDRDGNPVPIGVPGELVTGGDGVALGYFGMPDQTRRSFVPDTTSSAPQALCYRTADRVRWRSDGSIDFLGRFDEQLKIKGHRIEPGEIAAVLAEHPAVGQAAIVPRKSPAGDWQLLAFVVPREINPPLDLFVQLARHTAERLPSYMQPASFVQVAVLPLKPNGKLNVAALPPVAPVEPKPAPPRTGEHPDDAPVLALISELLSQPVSCHDNLYALGIDSLGLVRLVARLKSRLGLDLPISEVLKRADVGDILRLAQRKPQLTEDETFLAQIRDLYEDEPDR
jgi:amino acid adenylation domain-containing protein